MGLLFQCLRDKGRISVAANGKNLPMCQESKRYEKSENWYSSELQVTMSLDQ